MTDGIPTKYGLPTTDEIGTVINLDSENEPVENDCVREEEKPKRKKAVSIINP